MAIVVDYGPQEQAMQAYFRESEARAMTLGNRGPIRFAGGDHQEGGRGGEFFLDERDGTER